MGISENTLSMKTTSEFIVQMMTDEKDGEEFTREYLKARFLSSAVRALYNARRKAGFTQAQIAERLHTKQAAIARLEADTEGSMSLRRYVDFTLACGMDPLDITLEPMESVRDYIIHNPQAPRTQALYNAWHVTKDHSVPIPGSDVLQVESNFEAIRKAPLQDISPGEGIQAFQDVIVEIVKRRFPALLKLVQRRVVEIKKLDDLKQLVVQLSIAPDQIVARRLLMHAFAA